MLNLIPSTGGHPSVSSPLNTYVVPKHREQTVNLKAKNETPKENLMTRPHDHRRRQAVARYLAGDPIETICQQMACSKSWLYKWKARYAADDPSWARERSRRPVTPAAKTPPCIEQAVLSIRQTLAQNGARYGAEAIQAVLRQQGLEPTPSNRTIYRILQRHDQERHDTDRRLE
jgi:transposase